MALRIGAVEAKNVVYQYKQGMENVIREAQKNFEDMDFENANRRVEMEKLINNIKSECEEAISQAENVYFEG